MWWCCPSAPSSAVWPDGFDDPRSAARIAVGGLEPGAVIAIGPAIMMKAVSEQTRPLQIKTLVSLNTIMIDGTGMCGGCRVAVGGDSKFVCVDGPEFDGHLVDWDLLMSRQRIYLAEEGRAREEWLAHEHERDGHACCAGAA